MSDEILITTQARICKIQLNRPAKKNALTHAMYTDLAAALCAADADPQVRACFITGCAESFTSGNDINDFIQRGVLDEDSPATTFLQAISQMQKPLVAAVNGLAIGIGTTLLLHCDLVYAAASARFRLPFVNLGLVPEAASSLLLPQMIGQRHAAELLLLGDFFDAETAQTVGIVNAVYADETLLDLAWQKAEALAAQPPAALRLTKSLLKRSTAALVAETMREEAAHFKAQLQSPEALEAMQAFMERRSPDFSQFS
jgi:enoyl-CoA hydratase/carnithine racemase